MPTSSLINCPQGHVYSAVYQFCPYCPQPESAAQVDFATRIEEPITTIEPAPPSSMMSSDDLSTQAEPFATNYETRIESIEEVETQAGPPEMFETRVGDMDLNEIIEHKNNTPPPAPPAPKASAPTEVMPNFAETTLAEMPAVRNNVPVNKQNHEPSNDITASESEAQAQSAAQSATIVSSDPQPKFVEAAQSARLHPFAPDPDRRTIVVADEDAQKRSSKGKIVGWLISYTRHSDGEDHRIYAGYNRIGANPVCDIVIEDETVSGSHAIIVHRDGRFLVKDDLSRNGTFVNGREITEAVPLQSYDQIRVGNTFLTFVAAEPIV